MNPYNAPLTHNDTTRGWTETRLWKKMDAISHKTETNND